MSNSRNGLLLFFAKIALANQNTNRYNRGRNILVQRIGNRCEVRRAGEPPVYVSILRSGLKFLVSGASVITLDSRKQAGAFTESVAEV